MTRRRDLAVVPAPLLFLVSGTTMYVGAAVAVGLFDVLPAAAVAWLRIVVAAVVLCAWRRPWRRRWSRRELAWAGAFGLALAGMNVAFYVAIDHLPLGTAVAVEFVGPVAVAALTGRSWRERAAIVVAAAGVVLLAGAVSAGGAAGSVVGLVAVLVAAAMWAGYILLGRRAALGGDGVTTLAVAMAVGAVAYAPFLTLPSAPVLTSWSLAGAVVAVALLSSVVPYVLDQVVLRRVGTAVFAVLLALLPATATVVGAVVLRQVPTLVDVVGLVLVSAAIALTSERRRPAPEPSVAS